LFTVVGLLLILLVLLLVHHFDDRIRTPEQLDRASALPMLATVMQLSSDDGNGQPGLLVGLRAASAPAKEAYRVLRANLDLALLEHPSRIVLVTSALSGEGKSMTAANLALTLAQAG